MKRWRKLPLRAAAMIVLLAGAFIYIAAGSNPFAGSGAASGTAAPAAGEPAGEAQETKAAPPASGTAMRLDPVSLSGETFTPAGENGRLLLSVHERSGHFKLEDKLTGEVYRSFPHPGQWQAEAAGGDSVWLRNLASPLLYGYINFSVRQDQALETNWLDQNGTVRDFALTGAGFTLTYAIPSQGISIPVEVRLGDDYVETRIIDEGIADSEAARLSSISLYPFFGAVHASEEEGYLLLPDGPGVLVRFKPDRPAVSTNYAEPVYGGDRAFSFRRGDSGRQSVRFPVFGLKTGGAAFLGVAHEGEEYAEVTADPTNSVSRYNWGMFRQIYRSSYFQPTDTDKEQGFFAFARERFGTDRIVRYYLLEDGKADYAGMAARYRGYLMDEIGLRPLPANGEPVIPLHLSIVGGDGKEGFLREEYVAATTAAQAGQIVDELQEAGIGRMEIVYEAWQRKGAGSLGGLLPVEPRLGGNDGMRHFMADAAERGIPVYLEASAYAYNNNGRDGFRARRDGLRDMAKTVIGYENEGEGDVTYVSPRFAAARVEEDLAAYVRLGAAGLVFGDDIGRRLNSDFNARYEASRTEAKGIQESVLQGTGKTLGDVRVAEGNLYTLPYSSHVYRMPDDYSYDQFADETVPFAQIALHGLVTYSGAPGNFREDYRVELLRSIEYGAEPSFTVTFAESGELVSADAIHYLYSSNYKDWADSMLAEYRLFNEALGDVRGAFITGHRTLEPGVKEVAYSTGKRIVVNYNERPFSQGSLEVAPMDFAVAGGPA